MCVQHRQAIHASCRMREVMQQTVIQRTDISSTSTHKLSKKWDNRDEYAIRITCLKMIRIIYNKENQHIKMNKTSNNEDTHVKMNRIIIQQEESIC